MNEKAKCKNCTNEIIEEMAFDLIKATSPLGVKDLTEVFDYKKVATDLCNLWNWRKISEGSVVLTKEENEKLQENILELKNLEWYKFWHKKHTKKIEDLTTELETYRPTKLSGHGQCKCSKCGHVCWTDLFSRYKGQTLCNSCLKELIEKDNNDYRKETAKEILQALLDFVNCEKFNLGNAVEKIKTTLIKVAKAYEVEVEE